MLNGGDTLFQSPSYRWLWPHPELQRPPPGLHTSLNHCPQLPGCSSQLCTCFFSYVAYTLSMGTWKTTATQPDKTEPCPLRSHIHGGEPTSGRYVSGLRMFSCTERAPPAFRAAEDAHISIPCTQSPASLPEVTLF